MQLRPVTPQDSAFLFALASDPITRAASSVHKPPTPESHRAWMRRLESWDARAFIVEHGGERRGVIVARYEGYGTASISINIAGTARGQGFGRAAIRTLPKRIGWKVRWLARIRPANGASIRAFRSSGFRLARRGREVDTYAR